VFIWLDKVVDDVDKKEDPASNLDCNRTPKSYYCLGTLRVGAISEREAQQVVLHYFPAYLYGISPIPVLSEE